VNTRRITLIVAVVLALGTGILTLRYLSGVNAQAQAQQQAVVLKPIVLATRTIAKGEKITPDMLTRTQRPANEVEPDAVTDPGLTKGDVAMITIPAGATITQTKVGQPAELGITVRLKPGMRAVSIPVDRVKSVSNLVQPGDHVDVMASVARGAGIPPKTFTIIRGAVVLAINSQLEQSGASGATPAPDSGAAATVTLGVSPQQADLLTVADLNTTLRLALRSPQESIRSLPAETLQFADLGTEASASNMPPPPIYPAAAPPVTPVAVPAAVNVPAPVAPAKAPAMSGPAPAGVTVIDGDKVISGGV